VSARGSYPTAVLGRGEVGTDLMMKIGRRNGPVSAVSAMTVDEFPDVRIVFNTLPEGRGRAELAAPRARIIDLIPATGPWCVPAVNLDDHLDAAYLNMATGDAQVAVPVVAAMAKSAIVSYAEVVSSIPAKAAGAEVRADVDRLNETTSAAVQLVGGAQRAKTILILNPANPPIAARSTVYCLLDGDPDRRRIERDVAAMVEKVRRYAPGYRLKRPIQFENFSTADPLYIPETGKFSGTRVTAFVEVVGAADHFPSCAGTFDLMTAAAVDTAERIAAGGGRTPRAAA
jgi:acetaldehyde dehydrogenase